MDKFLIGSAIILFVFGMLLLVKPDIVKKLSDFLNKSLFPVEDRMRASHTISGAILLILGIIVFYLALKK
ncbi:MAG: hypothetical protein HZA72_01135 [Candidatus Omnitrophica bacterium]|nr:hypothetical protein [Candidatus Omnitrophota bacterium]